MSVIIISLMFGVASVAEGTVLRLTHDKRTKAQNKRATAHFEPFKEGVSFEYNY